MVQFIKNMAIAAAILAVLGVAAFLVLTYWDKIMSWISAGARMATNILKNFSGGNEDQADLDDFYDYDLEEI